MVILSGAPLRGAKGAESKDPGGPAKRELSGTGGILRLRAAPPAPPRRFAQDDRPIAALFFGLILGLIFLPAQALADVATDSSFGAAQTLGKVGNDFSIPHTLGSKVGGNLFHSFDRFSLATGESGTFTGPGDVTNILARVTGGSASNIDGTLRSTIPGANLFFINPKGVIFGPNASLDIDGSFTATTADYVKLSGGGRFDATTPANDVLTAAPVSAFGFLTAQSAGITATGSTLTGALGKKISFIGGDVLLSAATLTAAAGRVELWSSRAAGEIAASTGAGALTGGVDLLSSRVDVGGNPSGSVSIRGGRLTMNRSPVLSENTGAGVGGGIDVQVAGAVTIDRNPARLRTSSSGAGTAGDIAIRAGSVELLTDASIVSEATATSTAAAAAGAIRIDAQSISVASGSSISASTFGAGRGGLVDLQAEILNVVGVPADGATARITSNTSENATGAGGGVRIRADTLRLTGGGSISADTFGLGKGGDVDVTARDIFVAARGAVFKTGIFADSGGVGDPLLGVPNKISPGGVGGTLRIAADRIQITDGGLISTKSVGLGAGGDTMIDVRELIISKGNSALITGIAVDAAAGPGTGGTLRIEGDTIRVTGGGRISANAGDTGPGGDISIRAKSVFLSGTPDDPSTISAESSSPGNGGPAGTVEVIADRLQILNGARISAATFGGGAGGDVVIRAGNAFISTSGAGSLTGIAALSNSTTLPGPGGSVRADFGNLVITDNGVIAATTVGPGDGGDVSVTAKTMRLVGAGRISADTSGLGAGGSIAVRVGDLVISGRDGEQSSGIFSGSSATGEGGRGGTVLVRAETLSLTDLGSIAATSASTGAGGSVVVQATKLTLDRGATIEASATGAGIAGSVAITVQQPLELRSGAAVRTTSTVSDAGTVAITSASDINLLDSTVAVSALVGNAGSVSLIAPGTISLRNSSVVAEAGLNGGNVFIDPEFVILEYSRISANAILGAGGNILIIADNFLYTSSSVTASSEASTPGNVEVKAIYGDLSGALVVLSSSFVDVSTQLREQCARRLGQDFSSFLVLGRGATEQTPDEPLPSGSETGPVSHAPSTARATTR